MQLTDRDSRFINRLRGLSILCVVLGHLGLFWLYPPYSELLHAIVPVFFFVSGVVAYYTLNSVGTVGQFYFKRFAGLLVPYYLACLLSLVVYLALNRALPDFSLSLLMRWMTISPSPMSMPFPLGQVWFLHALAVISLVLPWILPRLRESAWVGFLFIIAISIVSLLQFGWRVDRSINFFGHNFYQAIIAFAYVIFGAMWFIDDGLRHQSVVRTVFLLSLVIAIGSVVTFGLDVDMSKHSYAPDLYYLSVGFLAISLLLGSQSWIERMCVGFPRIDRVLQFFSRHSLAIFLLHTFFIWGAEQWFGLVGVGSSPVRAICKVAFVLSATALVAPQFSALCNWITSSLLSSSGAGRGPVGRHQ